MTEIMTTSNTTQRGRARAPIQYKRDLNLCSVTPDVCVTRQRSIEATRLTATRPRAWRRQANAAVAKQ